jgi:hypothetical protein
MTATDPASPQPIPVHVGLAAPSPLREDGESALAPRRSMIGRNRRISPLEEPLFAWAEHGVEPRWLGMESSDCAAALDPNLYWGHGIDEFERFLAGARGRNELALVITTIGNVNDHSPRPVGATADASISLHGVEERISGARLPAAPTISVAEGLDAADRDLGLRLRNGRPSDAPWWGLELYGAEVWSGAGGSSTRHDVEGKLQPILVDGLDRPVVAAWTPAAGDQRWYVVPDVCDWHNILDWLVQRALPRYVPGALRRARSPLALDPALQTAAEAKARSALAELEASSAARRRELEERLAAATANAEPIRNGLLYGTSADLVDAVATVLRAAGLAVVDLDDLLGDTVSADLLVSLGPRQRLIEVKSASGNASESLVGQLETHLRTWPQLRPDQPVDGGVLIVNHQHRLEPDQRSDAVYGRPEFVAALALPVLPTRALFEWWRSSNWEAIRTAVLGDREDPGQDDREPDNGPSSPRQPREPVPGPVRGGLLGRLGRRPRPDTLEGRDGRS